MYHNGVSLAKHSLTLSSQIKKAIAFPNGSREYTLDTSVMTKRACVGQGAYMWLAMGVVRFETAKPWRGRCGAGGGLFAYNLSHLLAGGSTTWGVNFFQATLRSSYSV